MKEKEEVQLQWGSMFILHCCHAALNSQANCTVPDCLQLRDAQSGPCHRFLTPSTTHFPFSCTDQHRDEGLLIVCLQCPLKSRDSCSAFILMTISFSSEVLLVPLKQKQQKREDSPLSFIMFREMDLSHMTWTSESDSFQPGNLPND